MIGKRSAILAILLVPCLIVDPAFAAGDHSEFIVQALAPQALHSGAQPPQTKTQFWSIARGMLTDKTIRARRTFSADQLEKDLRLELEHFYEWKRIQWSEKRTPADSMEEALRTRIDALWALLILKRRWAPPPLPSPSELIQAELNPVEQKKSPGQSLAEYWKDVKTLRVIQIVPRLLGAYAGTLEKGFRAHGHKVDETILVAPKEADHAQFLKDLSAQVADVFMLHLHGAPDELEIMRGKFPGLNVVLVHRIVEFLDRYGREGIEYLRKNADVIVLSYQHELPLYRILFPGQIVVSIPLGFDEPQDLDESRLNRPITAVGSNTKWGEMRRLEDLLELKKAFEDEQLEMKILWYAAGEFDPEVDLNRYIDQGEVLLISNQEILDQEDFKDEAAFREWLLDRAGGRLIFRTEKFTQEADVPDSLRSRLADWESKMVDFDTQIFRNSINRDWLSEDSSGRLHRGVVSNLFVVSDSPAMLAIEKEEELNVVYIPHKGKGRLDYRTGVRNIIDLVNNPLLRRQKIESNIETARKRTTMKAIAHRHMILARKLLGTAA